MGFQNGSGSPSTTTGFSGWMEGSSHAPLADAGGRTTGGRRRGLRFMAAGRAIRRRLLRLRLRATALRLELGSDLDLPAEVLERLADEIYASIFEKNGQEKETDL